MLRPVSTFIGIDLGGARGKTTAVAHLALSPPAAAAQDHHPVSVCAVTTRRDGVAVWNDETLLDFLTTLDDTAVIAVNAPLTVPACVRCQLIVCPGKERCEDPAVVWLRDEGTGIALASMENDLDRIATIPPTSSSRHSEEAAGLHRPQLRIEPYVHRGTEIAMHYQRGIIPRDSLGRATGPIAARAAHLRRVVAGLGFRLNRNLLEVSSRATVHVLFGERAARDYKRDADPWATRARILESLDGMHFSPRSRLAREDTLRNDHCFDALVSAYTAYLWARDGWTMPAGAFDTDGWIWAPPKR